MWEPKCGSLKSTGKLQESATFLQRSFFNVALQFFGGCSATFGQMMSALQKSGCCSATSAAQLPKTAAQLPFSLVACCMQGWGLEGWGLGPPEMRHFGQTHATPPFIIFRAERTPKHKDFTKTPMPESTFFRGLQLLKFFVFGLFCSLKCWKNANIKSPQRGPVARGPAS